MDAALHDLSLPYLKVLQRLLKHLQQQQKKQATPGGRRDNRTHECQKQNDGEREKGQKRTAKVGMLKLGSAWCPQAQERGRGVRQALAQREETRSNLVSSAQPQARSCAKRSARLDLD